MLLLQGNSGKHRVRAATGRLATQLGGERETGAGYGGTSAQSTRFKARKENRITAGGDEDRAARNHPKSFRKELMFAKHRRQRSNVGGCWERLLYCGGKEVLLLMLFREMIIHFNIFAIN